MARKNAAEAQLNDERAKIGDNHNIHSPESRKQLKALTERIMRLWDQRDEINADMKEVFKEVGEAGFHGPTLRKAIARKRKIDKDEAAYRSEEENIAAYFAALWQPDLPFEPITAEVRLARAGLDA